MKKSSVPGKNMEKQWPGGPGGLGVRVRLQCLVADVTLNLSHLIQSCISISTTCDEGRPAVPLAAVPPGPVPLAGVLLAVARC